MMKVSQNQYAEMLLKIDRRPRCAAASERLKAWGIAGRQLHRGRRIRVCRGTTTSRRTPWSASCSGCTRTRSTRRAFPRPAGCRTGRDAGETTRRERRPKARCRAKTGTVDNVRAIAGYVETGDGETLVFSIIANNFTVPTQRDRRRGRQGAHPPRGSSTRRPGHDDRRDSGDSLLGSSSRPRRCSCSVGAGFCSGADQPLCPSRWDRPESARPACGGVAPV